MEIVLQLPLEKKIEIIAKEIYGADGIDILPDAGKRLSLFTKQVNCVYFLLKLSAGNGFTYVINFTPYTWR